MPAWVNLLLLSSSGPIKTPVGACATAAASVELGVETIHSGKAKVVLVGGYDDFSEEGSYEFAQMKATANNEDEKVKGRFPFEACRPTTTQRAGFTEAQGAGMQLLVAADLAFEMGLPIYGVVALTNTATDKEGRSLPAPGQGILTTARERTLRFGSPLLRLPYRLRRLDRELRHIEEARIDEMETLREEIEAARDRYESNEEIREPGEGSVDSGDISDSSWQCVDSPSLDDAPLKSKEDSSSCDGNHEDAGLRFEANLEEFKEERETLLQAEADHGIRMAKRRWGNFFFANASNEGIAPLRGALAVFGLGIDDIRVASFHGTSTKLNDVNESEVTQRQMESLQRSEGNPLLVVCQKSLTGHPKGAAASWMLNGLLQIMSSGLVPGNRNADDIDAALREFTHLVYPSKSIQTDGIDAALMKSFGFGQAGAEILLIHPDHLLSAIPSDLYIAYKKKRAKREARTFRAFQEVLCGKRKLVRVKTKPPYTDAQQQHIYLNPAVRAKFDAKAGTWRFFDHDVFSVDGALKCKVKVVCASSPTRNHGKSKLEGKRSMKRDSPTPCSVDGKEQSDASSIPCRDEEEKATRKAPLLTCAVEAALMESVENFPDSERGIGVDMEPVQTFQGCAETFLERNFTASELRYARKAPCPAATLAGKWAAKEAIIKAISNFALDTPSMWKSASAPLRDIEICSDTPSRAPKVVLHAAARRVADISGVKLLKVSISHTDEFAVANALVR
jgi:phosphopantetheine--protein transferase-like protein